jgi:hypothetical protein
MPREARITPIEGDNLNLFVKTVIQEFLTRNRFDNIPDGPRRINTIQTVAAEVYGSLSKAVHFAIVSDLYTRNEEFYLEREATDVFSADGPAGILGELACEVARQYLRQDEPIRELDDEWDRRTDF